MRKLTLLTLILTGFFVAACGEPAEREAKYVERGKALYEEGDYEDAYIEFANALQINPNGSESTYYQGLIREAEGNLSSALSRFKKVYAQDENHVRAILKLGNIYLITNSLDLAQEMADKAIALAPDNADLGALRAGIALRRQNPDEAMALAAAVLAQDPAHVAAAGILARILNDRGETAKAVSVLESAIQLNPENQNLRRVKILLHLESGDLQAAEKVYFELFALAPDFLDYRKELVRQYIAYGRLDDGEKLLRDLIAEFPDELEPKQLLVDFLLNQRSFEAAEREMLGFVAESPDDDDLRLDLAGIYQAQGLSDKAELVYEDILDRSNSDKHNVLSRVALAQIYLDRGQMVRVADLLKEVLADDPENGAAILLQTRVLLAADDYSAAILNLRDLLRREPESRPGLVLITQAHLMAKQPDLAIEALRRLTRIDPLNDRARSLLASLLTRRGELESAFPLLEEVLAQQPDNLDALVGKFEILLSGEAWSPAESVARTIQRHAAGEALGYELLGRLYQRQGRYDEAAAEFRAALVDDANSSVSLTGLVQSYFAQDRAADAEKLLQERLANNSQDALAYKLLGEVYQRRQGGIQAAIDAYSAAIAQRPEWAEPYLRLALLYREQGQTTQMVEVLERGLEHAPGHEALNFALASSYEAAGDPLQAIEIYEAMIRRNADNVAVANNLVALISDYDFENERRLALAERLAQTFQSSNQAVLLDTLGWVHYRLGNYDEAIDFLERALANGGDFPQVRYHLGMVYLELGEPERARRELELAVQSEVTFPGLRKARRALGEL